MGTVSNTIYAASITAFLPDSIRGTVDQTGGGTATMYFWDESADADTALGLPVGSPVYALGPGTYNHSAPWASQFHGGDLFGGLVTFTPDGEELRDETHSTERNFSYDVADVDALIVARHIARTFGVI